MVKSIYACAAARPADGAASAPELAPSPSSEVNGSAVPRIGGSGRPFSCGGGGRNLDTAFESALTDCRRKRLRADVNAHGSGEDAHRRWSPYNSMFKERGMPEPCCHTDL